VFRHSYFAPLSLISLVLGGCGSQISTSSGTPPVGNQQAVGVSGTHMTLNDSPWLSRGVVLQGYVRPLATLNAAPPSDQTSAALLNARKNYNSVERAAIRAYGADTIRFQISQPALDPNNTALYDPEYFSDVVTAIKDARQAGFVVMIMMQDEPITGDTSEDPLPTSETQSDWDLFTPVFGSDRGVVFELYNEPTLLASPTNWQLWLNGGTVAAGGQTYTAIGMQPLVNHLRTNGAQNVLVLDALADNVTDPATNKPVKEAAATLENMQAPIDPLNRLVYAVHPYQHGLAVESQWDAEFGIPSKSVPVWADEWSAPEGMPLGLGSLTDTQVAVDLLNYLNAHSIPLCTGAFDVTKFVVQDVNPWTLTDYDPATPMKSSGRLVYNDFAADYSRQLTVADGL
jgi:endoglucanase